jgi:hypothetical protein
MNNVKGFCEIIRQRSREHRLAIDRLKDLPGMVVSILRQELDSMVRVIFLLSIPDIEERNRLISQTIEGKKWTIETKKGKWREISDKEMVDLANQLQGWSKSVYKFGCAFIHLSNYHAYKDNNPLEYL